MKKPVNVQNPFIMAAGLLLVFLVIYVLHYLYILFIGAVMDRMNIWIYMLAAAMVFSLFSTINLLYAKDTGTYYYRTIMAFASLLILGVLLAGWISGQSILELSTYRRIVLSVVVAFMVFISIASLIKSMENWSKKKDEEFLNK